MPKCSAASHFQLRGPAVMDSLPPTAIPTERICLSMALGQGRAAPRVLWSLTAADFADVRHRELWPVARRAAAKGRAPDWAAVMDLSQPRGTDWATDQAQADWCAYVADLAWCPWLSADDCAEAVAKIKRAAQARAIFAAAERLAGCWADADQAEACKAVIKTAGENWLRSATL